MYIRHFVSLRDKMPEGMRGNPIQEGRRVHRLIVRTEHVYNWSREPEIRKIEICRIRTGGTKNREKKRRIYDATVRV
jgi:plasmid stabilization system protein ParE